MDSTAHRDSLDNSARPVRNRSALAVLSLVTSVVPVVGFFLGPILGVVALARLRRDPTQEGRLLAWAGIALGPVGTLLALTFALMAYLPYRQLELRPEVAMRSALAGDGDLFRDQMTGPGARVTSAELLLWARAIEVRFGALTTATLAEHGPDTAPAPGPDGDRMLASYIFTFERARVPALILFEAPKGSPSGLLQARIRRITLEPAEGARIVFPDDD